MLSITVYSSSETTQICFAVGTVMVDIHAFWDATWNKAAAEPTPKKNAKTYERENI